MKPGAPIASPLPPWAFSLQAAGKSAKTIADYLGTDHQLVASLEADDMPDDTEGVDARIFMRSWRPSVSAPPPASSTMHHRNLLVAVQMADLRE